MTKFSLTILQSIRTQFTLYITVAAIVILLLFVLIAVKEQHSDIKENARNELRVTGTIVQNMMNRMFQFGREQYANRIIIELAEHPQIPHAAIVNSRGVIVFSDHPENNGKLITQVIHDFNVSQIERTVTTGLSNYLYSAKKSEFTAYIPLNTSHHSELQNEIYIFVIQYKLAVIWYHADAQGLFKRATVCVILLLLSYILWLFFDKKITVPLQIVANAVTKIGKGESVSYIPIHQKNEIGLLARAIESMSLDRLIYEDELRKLSQAVEQSSESIVIINLDAEIEYVNNTFSQLTGYSKDEAVGQNLCFLKSDKTPQSTFDDMWETLLKGKNWQGEINNKMQDGTEFIEWVTITPIRDSNEKITHYLCIKQNITDRKAAEQRNIFLAYYDTLTYLPNRIKLTEILKEYILEEQYHAKFGSVLLIDVDRFQSINDVRGYEFGDALLIEIVGRLTRLLGENCTLARFGSDAFVILTPLVNAGRDEVIQQTKTESETILVDLKRPFIVLDEEVSITASLGLAVYTGDDDSPDEILRHAETALHLAKQKGGNHSVFYEMSYGAAVKERFQIERELRHAIENEDLRLYLQPQVNFQGELDGAEVLVRWQHPEKGLIPPCAFIPIAEESGLIVDLGCWVLIKSLEIIAKNKLHNPPLRLSVNMSPRHFRKVSFIPWIKQVLVSTGADPNYLTLEVTEGLFIDDIADVIDKMNELTTLGICISIDDFGTGYSSLAYLKRLPVHELKIDQSFIQDVTSDESNASLVETILLVAKQMRLKVVAEGVETIDQAEFIKKKGDIIYQGYLYGKPQPADNWCKRWYGKNSCNSC